MGDVFNDRIELIDFFNVLYMKQNPILFDVWDCIFFPL